MAQGAHDLLIEFVIGLKANGHGLSGCQSFLLGSGELFIKLRAVLAHVLPTFLPQLFIVFFGLKQVFVNHRLIRQVKG